MMRRKQLLNLLVAAVWSPHRVLRTTNGDVENDTFLFCIGCMLPVGQRLPNPDSYRDGTGTRGRTLMRLLNTKHFETRLSGFAIQIKFTIFKSHHPAVAYNTSAADFTSSTCIKIITAVLYFFNYYIPERNPFCRVRLQPHKTWHAAGCWQTTVSTVVMKLGYQFAI